VSEQPGEPEARGVHIDAQPGTATISIDGTPLPTGSVTGYTIQHDIIGGLPMVVLHTRQPDGVAFDGLARVAVGIPQTPGELIADFLAQVDPALLDQEALNHADYDGGPGATARAMLTVLAAWAKGAGHAGP